MIEMTDEALLEHIKAVNRVTTDDLGIVSELQELIESAKMDLSMSGVRGDVLVSPYAPIIVRAISLYTKANFGFDNPDSEKLMESYRSLETHLALSEEYRGVVVDEIQ